MSKKLEKLKANVSEKLEQDEEIIASVLGAYKSTTMGKDTLRNGIFVATQKRLVFYGKRTFGYDMESFPYGNISSIDMGKKLLGHNITFYASGNKVSLEMINHGDIDGLLQHTQKAIS